MKRKTKFERFRICKTHRIKFEKNSYKKALKDKISKILDGENEL